MYFITTKRMLEVCFSAHPNIQYRTSFISSMVYQEMPPAIDFLPLYIIKNLVLQNNRKKRRYQRIWHVR